MRILIAALLAAFVAVPAPVEAACDTGRFEGACETPNGHYRIRTPPGTGPFPAVLYLYGSTGNSGKLMGNDSFVEAFVARGYAVIVPAALDLLYEDGKGSGWFLRNERGRKDRDDMAFVEEVLADAAVRHRVDRRRVLIAGMSRGGFLAWELACHKPGIASAFAPIAGGYLGQMPDRCAHPVRLLHTHGAADRVVPLEPDAAWRSGGETMHPLADAMTTMAHTGGCLERGGTEQFREYRRRAWRGCPPGAGVEMLLHGGGHTIPLSWYSTVIDWFERDTRAPVARSTGGGRPVFKGANAREGGATGGRFKRVPQ